MGYKVYRSAGSLMVLAVLVLATAQSGFACVGARALAMGGAFVGLADDVSTTYWNPAGLVQLPNKAGQTDFTWMHTATNRDKINYQEFWSFAAPATPRGKSMVGMGVIQENIGGGDELYWTWVSLATPLGSKLSLGTNLKLLSEFVLGANPDSSETFVDLALFSRINDRVSAGLLVQNIFDSLDAPAMDNWRPGLAFRPDSNSVVSLELYDATNNFGLQALRAGYERILKNGWAVRGGWYMIGKDGMEALTFGAGKVMGRSGGTALDLAVMTGDVDTILLSLTVK